MSKSQDDYKNDLRDARIVHALLGSSHIQGHSQRPDVLCVFAAMDFLECKEGNVFIFSTEDWYHKHLMFTQVCLAKVWAVAQELQKDIEEDYDVFYQCQSGEEGEEVICG